MWHCHHSYHCAIERRYFDRFQASLEKEPEAENAEASLADKQAKKAKAVVLSKHELPSDPTHTEQPEFGVYAKPLAPLPKMIIEPPTSPDGFATDLPAIPELPELTSPDISDVDGKKGKRAAVPKKKPTTATDKVPFSLPILHSISNLCLSRDGRGGMRGTYFP